MRRVLAIVAMAALICSTAFPVWANVCATMQRTPLCHRAPMHQNSAGQSTHHHCDGMAEEGDAAPQSPTLVNGHSGDCPMQCCTQAKAGTSSALPATSFIPTLVPSQNHFYFPDVVFSRTGFSSHTDRGPPAA